MPGRLKQSLEDGWRVFAVEVLVCVHCAGKLRLVEIATEAAAIKRIIRDERRGRRWGRVRPEFGKTVFEQGKRTLKRC